MEAGKVAKTSSSVADNQDLVIEILSKLPIKSLIRFVCVSQEWSALIKSSHFVVIHQKYLHGSNRPNLCLLYGYTSKTKHHEIAYAGKEDTDIVVLDLPEEVQQDSYDRLIYIAGSSKGLVCLHLCSTRKEIIVIWNPATGQYRYLPKPLPFKGTKGTLNRPLLGFGFINDHDYKVVKVSHSKDLNAYGLLTYMTQVFTRSENSWREIKNCVPRGFEFRSMISSNGVLYCIGKTGLSRFVFCFKLHDEVGYRVPNLPPYRKFYGGLFKWENSVAYLTYDHDDDRKLDLWVMNKKSDSQMPIWNLTAQITTKVTLHYLVWSYLYLFVKRHVQAGQDQVEYDQPETGVTEAFKR